MHQCLDYEIVCNKLYIIIYNVFTALTVVIHKLIYNHHKIVLYSIHNAMSDVCKL